MKLVIKLGTTSITGASPEGVNSELIDSIVSIVDQLKAMGHQPILVSSGAIGLGSRLLGWRERPSSITGQQAAASVGQIQLAKLYETAFARNNQPIGQVLLTKVGMQDKERYLNARLTLRELLQIGVVPIVNENDVVTDYAIKFSDNDFLAAVVSELVGAEHLFILTDTAGLYTADPREDPTASLIEHVDEITVDIEAKAGGKKSAWGTGGMITKIEAAKMATACGTTVHILSHKTPGDILKTLSGYSCGTTFAPRTNPIDARKAWIACNSNPKGKIIIDEGAMQAIGQGKSLLPVGIKRIRGTFQRGIPLEICYESDEQMTVVAKGITKYSSQDLRRIKGHPSEQIDRILGYSYGNSAIHRDDLVLLSFTQTQQIICEQKT